MRVAPCLERATAFAAWLDDRSWSAPVAKTHAWNKANAHGECTPRKCHVPADDPKNH